MKNASMLSVWLHVSYCSIVVGLGRNAVPHRAMPGRTRHKGPGLYTELLGHHIMKPSGKEFE